MFLSKISWLGVGASFFAFAKLNMHILILLISLEALMLSLLMLILSYSLMSLSSFHMFLVILTFAACEAALGLSLLVSILRIRGNDFVSSFSTMNFYA